MKKHAITFADRLVLDHILCDLTHRAQWETDFIAGLATEIDCLNASNLHACTVSISEVTKCNARRKKRATSGGDVVLEFKLELDDQAQLDLQNMYDNNIGELNHTRNINFPVIINKTCSTLFANVLNHYLRVNYISIRL